MAVERSAASRVLQAGPLTWLLAAACGWALLLWLLALFGLGGRIGLVRAPTSLALPAALPAQADRVGPLSDYPQAAQRPLFTQDRRPRAFLAAGADAAVAGAGSGELDFILTGTLITPTVRLAVLQPSAGGDAQRVREGSAPEGAVGWRLVEVQPRRAVFEGSGGQMTLDLRTFGTPGAPPSAVPAEATAVAAQNAAATAADAAEHPADDAASAQQADDIRRRIEARRAQLRQGGANADDVPPPPSRPMSGPARR
ncbi:MAG: hypothetical protein JSS52_04790 [Proteobacteria bacterium]|nr:hypothetical protein [Pseudomonadota bacterium]